MNKKLRILSLLVVISLLFTACTARNQNQTTASSGDTGRVVEYSLTTGMANGKLAFIGVGGGIDGVQNPTLSANVGDTVRIHLTTDGMEHNIDFPDFNASSAHVVGAGSSTTLQFKADKGGTFTYYCSIPGHKEAGMQGTFAVAGGVANNNPSVPVTGGQASAGPVVVKNPPTTGADIVRDPAEVPPPIGARGPQTVRVNLDAVETKGQLDNGATYTYWTFNGQVPGPFIRVRVGDTLEVHLRNLPNSSMSHSVDFHAVTGPGGGSTVSQTAPGQETVFTAKAINPGLFVYHCATPMVAQHISNGMYGLILVEPEGGLPPVDHEFYVMQGELYTNEAFGSTGQLTQNVQALLDENPQYFVFNGAVGALTDQKPLKAKVGETVRIYFGVGGPNFTSSFHIIGEIFDRVYDLGSVTSPPLTDVSTVTVPAGGATIVELTLQIPGTYTLVDHALARAERGLTGSLVVDGPQNPEIFQGTPIPESGH